MKTREVLRVLQNFIDNGCVSITTDDLVIYESLQRCRDIIGKRRILEKAGKSQWYIKNIHKLVVNNGKKITFVDLDDNIIFTILKYLGMDQLMVMYFANKRNGLLVGTHAREIMLPIVMKNFPKDIKERLPEGDDVDSSEWWRLLLLYGLCPGCERKSRKYKTYSYIDDSCVLVTELCDDCQILRNSGRKLNCKVGQEFYPSPTYYFYSYAFMNGMYVPIVQTVPTVQTVHLVLTVSDALKSIIEQEDDEFLNLFRNAQQTKKAKQKRKRLIKKITNRSFLDCDVRQNILVGETLEPLP